MTIATRFGSVVTRGGSVGTNCACCGPPYVGCGNMCSVRAYVDNADSGLAICGESGITNALGPGYVFPLTQNPSVPVAFATCQPSEFIPAQQPRHLGWTGTFDNPVGGIAGTPTTINSFKQYRFEYRTNVFGVNVAPHYYLSFSVLCEAVAPRIVLSNVGGNEIASQVRKFFRADFTAIFLCAQGITRGDVTSSFYPSGSLNVPANFVTGSCPVCQATRISGRPQWFMSAGLTISTTHSTRTLLNGAANNIAGFQQYTDLTRTFTTPFSSTFNAPQAVASCDDTAVAPQDAASIARRPFSDRQQATGCRLVPDYYASLGGSVNADGINAGGDAPRVSQTVRYRFQSGGSTRNYNEPPAVNPFTGNPVPYEWYPLLEWDNAVWGGSSFGFYFADFCCEGATGANYCNPLP